LLFKIEQLSFGGGEVAVGLFMGAFKIGQSVTLSLINSSAKTISSVSSRASALLKDVGENVKSLSFDNISELNAKLNNMVSNAQEGRYENQSAPSLPSVKRFNSPGPGKR